MNPIDAEILEQGLTWEAYRALVENNADVFDEVWTVPAYTADDLDFFRRLPPLKVVAVGEDWCPDVYHTVPTWARLAEELDGWSFHMFRRDTGPQLIDYFLYRGTAKRVPVYAFYDQNRNLQAWWSGRGATAQHEMDGWLGGRPFSEFSDDEKAVVRVQLDDGYRERFRRLNFAEIRTQLGAFFHVY